MRATAGGDAPNAASLGYGRMRTPCNAARLADRDGASPRAARSRNDCAMVDFSAARRMMVDGQVRTSDVTDPRIIAALLELPRERFVPERQRPRWPISISICR